MRPSRRKRWLSWACSLSIYVVLSIAVTWPLALNMETHIAGDDEDIFNVYWGNWWVRQALSSGQNPYRTSHLIYPIGFDLTTFAFSPFLAVLSIPLNRVVSAAVAYNLIVLGTIVLCCMAMDQLVRYLTGSPWAARVAAIAFGLAPGLAAERSAHLNLTVLAWLPWAALFLTRLAENRAHSRKAVVRDVCLYAGTVGLAFLTRLHVGMLVLLFSGAYLAALLLTRPRLWHEHAWRRCLIAYLLSLLILIPIGIHLSQILAEPGGENVLREGAEVQQTDLLAYLVAPKEHPLFGSLTAAINDEQFLINDEYWAYIGFVPLVLAGYVSIRRPARAGPWLLTGLVFAILALGPCLCIGGKLYPQIKLPYAWAQDLFTLAGMDVPNRLNLAMIPALCVLVGLAYAELNAHGLKSLAWAVPALVAAEYLIVPMPLFALPSESAFYEQIAADQADYAIVDLPLTREDGEIHRYYQTIHKAPIVGGWDRRVPDSAFSFIDSVPLLRAWSGRDLQDTLLSADLTALAQANVQYVVLHKDQLKSPPGSMVSVFESLKPTYQDKNLYVWSTDTAVTTTHNVVRTFGADLALLQPAVVLSTGAGQPELAASVCWFLDSADPAEGEAQMIVFAADGRLIAQESKPLAMIPQKLTCQDWSWSLDSLLAPGNLRFHIMPTIEGRALGDYVFTQPLSVFRDAAGPEDVFILGQAFPVIFAAPIESLGYHIVQGENAIWLDLYWRSLADHYQPYKLFVQLFDTATGQVVKNSDALLPQLDWQQGDIVQAHRMLFLDDLPPGEYRLGFGLYMQDDPDRIPATDPESGAPWSGNVAVLNTLVLVLPHELEGTMVSDQNRVVVYSTAAEQAPRTLYQPVDVQFANVGHLAGYSLQADEVMAGQTIRLTLYWTARSTPPTGTDYKVFVHLIDAAGQIVAQHDGKLVKMPIVDLPDNRLAIGRLLPRASYREDVIVDTHELVWQTGETAGAATILVGIYNEHTLERLMIRSSPDESLALDAATLQKVQIQ